MGSSHLDSSQGKQTRARVPDSPSSRASRNSHPAAARCQPPSPPGRLLPAETAARYIPAAAARPGPGEPLGSPLAGRRTRACRGSFPPPPPPAPRGKFPLSAATASAKLLLRVAAPPAAPSGKRRPSVRPSLARRLPVPRRRACELLRARLRRRLALSPSRPEPDSPPASLSPRSKCALCPAPIGRSSPPHRPKRPCSPLSLGAAGAGPPPFLPPPPSPRSWGWKRRSGGEEQPGPHSGRRLPLHLPSPSRGSGRGAERGGGARPRGRAGGGPGDTGGGEREGPAKGAAPAGRCCGEPWPGPRRPRPWRREPPPLPLPAPSRGAGIRDGERLRARSAPAPLEGRAGRSPPRPIPFRSRSPALGRAQVLRGCGAAVAEPLRGGGRGCPALEAAQRYPGPPLRPLINNRRCRRSPADLGTKSRPRPARSFSPAHGQKAPAAAGRCSLPSGCRHCPEPAGQPRPCRRPVRWGCAGQGRPGAAAGDGGAVALALARPAGGSARRRARSGGVRLARGACPEPGRGSGGTETKRNGVAEG